MRIRLRTNIGSSETDIQPPLLTGETREVSAELGRSLVDRGLAVEVLPPIPEPQPVPIVRAIPEPPAIAEAVELEIKPAIERKYRPKKPAVLNVEPRK